MQLRLQSGFAGVFSPDIPGRVIARKVRVCRRVPYPMIDAIEDARQVAPPRLQEAFEAAAIFGRQNLTRIGRTDSRESVGVTDPRFEERNLAIELQAIGTEGFFREGKLGIEIGREQTLVREVVHCEDRAGFLAVHSRYEDRQQPRMPIVGVYDVGAPVAHQLAQ